jgi:hypothetical protein
MSTNYAPRLNVLSQLVTVEKDKNFEYLNKFLKYQKIEDKEISLNLIKKEK